MLQLMSAFVETPKRWPKDLTEEAFLGTSGRGGELRAVCCKCCSVVFVHRISHDGQDTYNDSKEIWKLTPPRAFPRSSSAMRYTLECCVDFHSNYTVLRVSVVAAVESGRVDESTMAFL